MNKKISDCDLFHLIFLALPLWEKIDLADRSYSFRLLTTFKNLVGQLTRCLKVLYTYDMEIKKKLQGKQTQNTCTLSCLPYKQRANLRPGVFQCFKLSLFNHNYARANSRRGETVCMWRRAKITRAENNSIQYLMGQEENSKFRQISVKSV